MEWDDVAIVLSVRPHGEHGGVAHLLTRAHGRHAGLVHGARSRSNCGAAQPGNMVRAWWSARVADQLGVFRLEMVKAHTGMAMSDPARLSALSAACALADLVLPERQPHAGAFAALSALLSGLEADSWPSIYVHWELALLRDLGFGLDLGVCAVTGQREGLAFVSPRTGRAVSTEGAGDWVERLLPLPAFLVDGGEGDRQQIAHGLALAGHFLERHVLAGLHAPFPAARTRLVDRFRQ